VLGSFGYRWHLEEQGCPKILQRLKEKHHRPSQLAPHAWANTPRPGYVLSCVVRRMPFFPCPWSYLGGPGGVKKTATSPCSHQPSTTGPKEHQNSHPKVPCFHGSGGPTPGSFLGSMDSSGERMHRTQTGGAVLVGNCRCSPPLTTLHRQNFAPTTRHGRRHKRCDRSFCWFGRAGQCDEKVNTTLFSQQNFRLPTNHVSCIAFREEREV
jgi:hypothetical protein